MLLKRGHIVAHDGVIFSNVYATIVARAGKRGNICVGSNVSATMCPRLPVPLRLTFVKALANKDTLLLLMMFPGRANARDTI